MPQKSEDNWLLHGRTYDNQRFSPLTQISDANVKTLVPVAIIQTGIANSFEVTPIIVNGVMYVATPGDHVQAYDAASGEPLWVYNPTLSYSDLCCGPESRGVAVAYGKVFVAQLDGVIVALDAKTGALLWKSDPAATLPQPTHFYSFTGAPQVYHGMVVIGSAGAEYPIRGFVQAYDAGTGKLIWRFNTIPAPGEPGSDSWSGDSWKFGGGSVWNAPAFDPERGLISFGVGNPNPDILGDVRKGDNAYTDSIVALHARDGKLAWWYQTVAHDLWDLDNAGPVIFLDAADARRKQVPAAADPARKANCSSSTGKPASCCAPPPPLCWKAPTNGRAERVRRRAALSFGQRRGRMVAVVLLAAHPQHLCDGLQRRLDLCRQRGKAQGRRDVYRRRHEGDAGRPGRGGGHHPPLRHLDRDQCRYRQIRLAVSFRLSDGRRHPGDGGQSGVRRRDERQLQCLRRRTGRKLWHFSLGAGVNAPPVTYRVNGVQYVAVARGGNGANSNNELAAMRGHPAFGDVLAIFALPAAP